MIEFEESQTRSVMNNFWSYTSVTQMLTNLNWPTLVKCREEQKAIMTPDPYYKAVNKSDSHLDKLTTVHLYLKVLPAGTLSLKSPCQLPVDALCVKNN